MNESFEKLWFWVKAKELAISLYKLLTTKISINSMTVQSELQK